MASKNDPSAAPAAKNEEVRPPGGEDPPAAAAAAEPEKRTPREWASHLGHQKPAGPKPQQEDEVDWRYAAARELFLWGVVERNLQAADDRFTLTESDYTAALAAAAAHPCAALPKGAIPPERGVDADNRARRDALLNHKPRATSAQESR